MESLNFTVGLPEIILEVHKVKNLFIAILQPYLPFFSQNLKYREVFPKTAFYRYHRLIYKTNLNPLCTPNNIFYEKDIFSKTKK